MDKDKWGNPVLANPTVTQIKYCKKHLEATIKKLQPALIICLGDIPFMEVAASKATGKPKLDKYQGMVFPSQKYKTWVAGTYYPYEAFTDKYISILFENDLKEFLTYVKKPIPTPLTGMGNRMISNPSEAINILEEMSNSTTPVAFDYETTGVSAYKPDAQVLTVAVSNTTTHGYCIPFAVNEYHPNTWNLLDESMVLAAWKKFLKSPVTKIVANYTMEFTWSLQHFGVDISESGDVHDTQLASHVVYCKPSTYSLDIRTQWMVGESHKGMVNVKDLINEPLRSVAEYNCYDARYTLLWWERVNRDIDKYKTRKFYDFYRQGIECFAHLTHDGFNINPEALDEIAALCDPEIEKLQAEIEANDVYLAWLEYREAQLWKDVKAKYRKKCEDRKKLFPDDAEAANKAIARLKVPVMTDKLREQSRLNMNSSKQLGECLFKMCGLEAKKFTNSGYSTDAESLNGVIERYPDHPAAKILTAFLGQKKFNSLRKRMTEYKGLIGADGRIHGSFNLTNPKTFRSSSSAPNMQNISKRDKFLKQIRKAFIPTQSDHVIVDVDFSALELVSAALLSNDQTMIDQINNDVDLHYFWSAKVLNKPESEVTKEERGDMKTDFVFRHLYGSKPETTAKGLEAKGVPIAHTLRCIAEFERMYPDVRKWQDATAGKYFTEGYVESIFGARLVPSSPTKVYNYPVQSGAFSITLWAMIQLEKYVRHREDMYFIAQVHDSCVLSIARDSLVTELPKIKELLLLPYKPEFGKIKFDVDFEIGRTYYDVKGIKI